MLTGGAIASGESGHLIGRCGKKPNYPICVGRGLQADHRPGDPSKCEPVPPGWCARIMSARVGSGRPPFLALSSPGTLLGSGSGGTVMGGDPRDRSDVFRGLGPAALR